MPSKKERVAAYLPSFIDKRFKSFKAERGINGDSQALIAILSEFFEVSQDVAHLSESEFVSLSKQIESLTAKVAHLEDELLGELKSSPKGDLKSELLSDLQGELFERLKPDLKSELINELKSELLNNPAEIPTSPGQLPLILAERVEQDASSDSDLPSKLQVESPNSDSSDADQPVSQIPLSPIQEMDQKPDRDELPGEPISEPSERVADSGEVEGSEPPVKLKSKPLDGSVPWSGVELSKRLKVSQSHLSQQQHTPDKEFAEWSRKREIAAGLEGLAWRRVGRKYFPIIDDHQDF